MFFVPSGVTFTLTPADLEELPTESMKVASTRSSRRSHLRTFISFLARYTNQEAAGWNRGLSPTIFSAWCQAIDVPEQLFCTKSFSNYWTTISSFFSVWQLWRPNCEALLAAIKSDTKTIGARYSPNKAPLISSVAWNMGFEALPRALRAMISVWMLAGVRAATIRELKNEDMKIRRNILGHPSGADFWWTHVKNEGSLRDYPMTAIRCLCRYAPPSTVCPVCTAMDTLAWFGYNGSSAHIEQILRTLTAKAHSFRRTMATVFRIGYELVLYENPRMKTKDKVDIVRRIYSAMHWTPPAEHLKPEAILQTKRVFFSYSGDVWRFAGSNWEDRFPLICVLRLIEVFAPTKYRLGVMHKKVYNDRRGYVQAIRVSTTLPLPDWVEAPLLDNPGDLLTDDEPDTDDATQKPPMSPPRWILPDDDFVPVGGPSSSSSARPTTGAPHVDRVLDPGTIGTFATPPTQPPTAMGADDCGDDILELSDDDEFWDF